MKTVQWLLLITLCLYGAEPSIDEQIEAIQSAPLEKRHEMMNTLKRTIATMNTLERQKAIGRLQQHSGQKIQRQMQHLGSKPVGGEGAQNGMGNGSHRPTPLQ